MSLPVVRVEARFKNARLYAAIREAAVPDKNYKNSWDRGRMSSFCRTNGFRYQAVGELLTLKGSPYRTPPGSKSQRGSTAPLGYSLLAERLSIVLDVPPEELFPKEIYEKHWPRGVAFDVPAVTFLALSEAPREFLSLPPMQDETMATTELRDAMMRQLETLTSDKERTVLRKRFGFDGREMELAEIAEDLQLSRSRVHQLEQAGLRHMRHKSRARPLRAFL